MFAVLKTGGKQYTVRAGDVLRVEKLAAIAGDKIQFNEILMVGGDTVTVGAPMVAGAAVPRGQHVAAPVDSTVCRIVANWAGGDDARVVAWRIGLAGPDHFPGRTGLWSNRTGTCLRNRRDRLRQQGSPFRTVRCATNGRAVLLHRQYMVGKDRPAAC